MATLARQTETEPGLPRAAVLASLCELARRVELADQRSGETDPAALAGLLATCGVLLEQTLFALQSLERVCSGEADLRFAAEFELRRVQRELREARSVEERLVAIEAVLRKLRRSIAAVLAAEPDDSGQPGGDAPPAAGSDLESGLAVRRLYAGFRRTLRRPADESFEQVLYALRYAAGALGSLFSSPEYAAVRASDRAVLRRLRERLVAWTQGERTVQLGLQALEDVWTVSQLLRDINRRQEIAAHDRRQIAWLLADRGHDPRAWFSALETLIGLDDALDVLIETGRRTPLESMDAVRVRLQLMTDR
jgi:hypothetical protein